MIDSKANSNKFQVFISFKNTDNNKDTVDKVIAEEVYDFLSKKGLKVFYSKKTLAKLGASEYQHAIAKALNEAQVLILIATKKEYIESEWVQKEWSSFLDEILAKRKPKGQIFKYFQDVNSDEIPLFLRNYQTIYHKDTSTLTNLYDFVSNALSNQNLSSSVNNLNFKQPSSSNLKYSKTSISASTVEHKSHSHGIVIALIILLTIFAATIFLIPGKDIDKIKAMFMSKNYYESGIKLFKAGNFKEAKKELTRAVEAKPFDAKSQFMLAATYEKLSQTDEAVIYYQKTIELDPGNFEAKAGLKKLKGKEESAKLFNSAQDLLKAGNYKKAIEELKKYVELTPDEENGFCSLGAAYEKIKAEVEAAAAYEKALKINPENQEIKNRLRWLKNKVTFKTHYDKGMEFSRKSKYEEAAGEFKKALDINPQSVETIYNLALIYEQLSKKEEALKEFKRIIIINSNYLDTQSRVSALEKKLSPPKIIKQPVDNQPGAETAANKKPPAKDIPEYQKYFEKGIELINEKKFAEAVEEIRKAIRFKSDSAEFFCKLGVALEGDGQNAEALDAYNIALNIDVNCSEAKLNKDKMYEPFYENGLKLEAGENYTEAVKELECALKIKSDSADLLYHLGINCQAAGIHDKAVDYLNRSLQFRPNFPDVYKTLGKSYLNRRENNKAIMAYRKYIQLMPGNVSALRDISADYKKAGIYSEASYTYKEITRLEPHDTFTYFNLGYVSNRLKKYDDAIFAYLKVLNNDPKNVDANYELASAYFKLKDYKNARKFYREVIYINPDHQEAHRMIEELNKISRGMR